MSKAAPGRIFLVRHAPAEGVAGRAVGWWDPPLSERGRDMAAELAATRSGPAPVDIIASDLVRARETASILGRAWGVPVREDARWRELHLGAWEGMLWDEVQARHPEELRRWGEQWTRSAPPGGETLDLLEERVRLAFHALLRQKDKGGLSRDRVIVGHAGSLRALLRIVSGGPIEALFDEPLGHGRVSLLEVRAGGHPCLAWRNRPSFTTR